MRCLPADLIISLPTANEYFFLAENKLKESGEKYEFEYAGKKMSIERQGEDFYLREEK